MSTTRPLAALFAAALALSACGGSDADSSGPTDAPVEETPAGIRVVAPEQAADTIANPPVDLVILDVRTVEEFEEARLEGAVMLDFYRDDFAEALAEFDPDVPYVLYCRSGNRSSGARAIMAELGFTDVEDVDGGIVSWIDAGLPVVSG
ncbi:MAG: rhodanese-like domain-containing protein [Ilumatobacter sp.]